MDRWVDMYRSSVIEGQLARKHPPTVWAKKKFKANGSCTTPAVTHSTQVCTCRARSTPSETSLTIKWHPMHVLCNARRKLVFLLPFIDKVLIRNNRYIILTLAPRQQRSAWIHRAESCGRSTTVHRYENALLRAINIFIPFSGRAIMARMAY